MTMTRNVLAVTALCALLGPLSACSGSDSDGPSSQASATPSSGETYNGKDKDCTVNVKVTGKVDAAWKGPATVTSVDGKTASYQSASKDGSITVAIFPKQDAFPATTTVTSDGATYTSQTAKGIKADPKGGGATADADAVVLLDGKQKTVHVVAEFDC